MVEINTIYHGDCLDLMGCLGDESLDHILTDPPYLYLKGQKLERVFDEQLFFSECKRVLKKDGFIVLFGRGTSFYRWCTILADLGFTFKEEIIWDKTQNTSPVTPINRIHESIVIFSKGNGSIRQSFVPYTQIKTNPDDIVNDIKRIKSAINNKFEFEDLLHFLETNEVRYRDTERTLGNNTTVQTQMSQQSRVVKAMQAVKRGLKEKSIIRETRDHYNTIHPTQKPIKLIIRLLKLISMPGDVIGDFFMGSGAIPVACIQSGRSFIASEIEDEYYKLGSYRVKIETDLSNKLLFKAS